MTDTTVSTVTEATDMHDMVVVHRVFRRELRSIPELVRQTPPGDVERAAVVAGFARLVLSGLHLHHTSEDDLLWPMLLERAHPEFAVVRHMQQQHAEIAVLVDQIDAVLPRFEAEARPAVGHELASLVDRLRPVVVEHLDDEERLVLPIAETVITPDEWAKVGQAGVAKMSKAELPLMFGAVMEDATPAERRELLRVLPLPVRILMRVWGAGHYRRHVTKVRGSR